jgi:hypothetical protein
VAGCCGHGNEPSGCIKCWEKFFECLRDWSRWAQLHGVSWLVSCTRIICQGCRKITREITEKKVSEQYAYYPNASNFNGQDPTKRVALQVAVPPCFVEERTCSQSGVRFL